MVLKTPSLIFLYFYLTIHMSQSKNADYHKLIKKLANEQKIEALKGLLIDLNPVEIANCFLALKLKHRLTVIGLLDNKKASEVINNLQEHEPILEEIVKQMTTERLGDLIEEMDMDDAADVVGMLDDAHATEVLEELPVEGRAEITNLLKYDDESAGGIMDPQVISIQKDLTVGQATQRIKAISKTKDIDEFHVIYVVDEYNHLIGSVNLAQLFLADNKTLIKNIMDPDVIAVDVDLDQEKVASLAKEYDLVTVPVIDKHLKLLGRITNDDLMDVMYDEYNEDLGQAAGTGREEVLEKSVIKASGDRLPWLLLGLGGGALAAWVLSGYEDSISRIPEVAYFIPVVAALGGNIAIQSSSLVVRGLATGELRTIDLFQRAWKEIKIGIVNGLICAVVLFFLAWWITGNQIIGLTTSGALLIIVLLAAIVGTMVPMLLRRMQLDPAIATGPFITTTNDIIGVIIYLAITISVYNHYAIQ
jgi:magnesium transporter